MSAKKVIERDLKTVEKIKYESEIFNGLYHYMEINLFYYKQFSEKIQNSIDKHLQKSLFCYEKILYPELLIDLFF